MRTPVALVTGGNRGIGLEVARQLAGLGHRVYLGSRSLEAGERAAAGLAGEVRAIRLDVTDATSVDAAVGTIRAEQGVLDALVNNAAILYDTWQTAVDPDFTVVEEALATNTFGAWRLTIAALPLLRASDHPRIVNVSSGAGALTDMGGGTPAYRLSKAGLNALTQMLSAELARERVLVNAVCPGWVATDMGGSGGRPVPEGAAGVVWAATLPDDGPTGGFFRDRRPTPW